VRTTTMERVVQKVKVPVKVARRVEVKETRMVPRQVATRIPLDYYDPFIPTSSSSVPSIPSVVQPAASIAPRPSESGWKEPATGPAGSGNTATGNTATGNTATGNTATGNTATGNTATEGASRSSSPLPDPKTSLQESRPVEPARPAIDPLRPLELAPSPSGVQLRESTAPKP
jgi:hypothetical protein